jgi:ADP-ribose pyrophosphatase YjhB (NUDIX family)
VTAGSPSAQIISLRVDELRIGLGKAQFRDGDTVFLCRVAGVAVHEGRVLLHRSEHDDFWALPGGRIEVGESSTQALRREMLEEVGAEVTVGRLLWVVENFFQHYPLDQSPDTAISIDHHEIGWYLEMEVPADAELPGGAPPRGRPPGGRRRRARGGPRRGASGGDVDEALARRIGKALGRRRRRALAEIARPAARPLPDVVAWRAAASATADRAGLVLCGDVPAALGMLLRDRADRSPEGPAAVAAAATRPDVLALLAFAASEEHFLLRQRLRTAIA